MLRRIGLLSLLVCTMLLAGSAVAQTGLVSYWKLDEAAGTTSFADSSGSGDNGTCSGTSCPVLGVSGKTGTAASFVKGANYVSIGNPANLNFGTGSFTYSLWVYVPASIGAYDMPLWKGGGSAGSPGFDMEFGTGNWTANLADGSRSVQAVLGTETDNQWVLLTAVVDRSAGLFKAYKNGSLVASVSLGSLGSVSSSNPLYIGGLSGYRFNGTIDDVRIYNTALTSSDVANLYSGVTSSASAVAVAITPTSASLQSGGTQQFSATVTGTTNTAVTWSATGGTISTSGLYTAPSTSGTYTVKATSAADSTKFASATITVPSATGVQVSVSSPTSGATLGSSVQFAATASSAYPITGYVVYANSQNVYQTNNSTLNGSASLSAGTYTVLIRAWDSTGAYGTSPAMSITVGSSVGVSVSPGSASLPSGGTQQFTAGVTGTTNTSVNWSASGGTISYMGYYTAPSAAGTYKVTATSAADSTKSASAVVTVNAPVAVAVSPSSTSLAAGGTQQFTATVSGTSNTGVTWSATGGAISPSGLYTAPTSAGTYTITATSVADTTKQATAGVAVASSASSSWPPPLPSGALEYYVSSSGSDSNSGSQSSPWLTINHASQSIPGGRAVTVHVAPGTYNLNSSTCISTSVSGGGTSTPITFLSDQRGAAKINGMAACFYMWHIIGSYINVWGFDLTGVQTTTSTSPGTAVMLSEGAGGNVDVGYNTVHDLPSTFGSAIIMEPYGSSGYTGAPCSVHDNTFHNIAYNSGVQHGDYAVYIACGTNTYVYNNLIYNEGSIGIHCWHSANHVHIYNNTIANAQYIGIIVGTGDGGGLSGAYFDVTNNIVVNSKYGIMAESGSPGTVSTTSIFRNNLIHNNSIDWYYNNNGSSTTLQAAGMSVTGTVSGDPLFVSPSTGNYHLNTGSPAIGAGIYVGINHDLDGTPISSTSQVNIGVY